MRQINRLCRHLVAIYVSRRSGRMYFRKHFKMTNIRHTHKDDWLNLKRILFHSFSHVTARLIKHFKTKQKGKYAVHGVYVGPHKIRRASCGTFKRRCQQLHSFRVRKGHQVDASFRFAATTTTTTRESAQHCRLLCV